MSSVSMPAESSLEIPLDLSDQGWIDRLRSGMWPKPLVFWAVVFYIGLFIIRPWENIFPELQELRFERLSVMAVAGYVFLRRGVMIRPTFQNLSMLALFGAVFLSGKLAFDTSLSDPEVTEFLGFTLIYFLIQKAVRSPYQLLFILACFLMLTTSYVGKSIWEYAFNGASQFMMGVHRLAGIDLTYGHPNTMGRTMVCSLPFAIFFYRMRGQFCRTWPRRMRTLFRWALLSHMFLCVTGILLTRSRAAAIGLVFFTMIWVVRQKGTAKKLKWGVVGLVTLLVGFAVAPSDIQNRIRSIWDDNVEAEADMGGANASKEGRYEGFLAGLAIFKQFPITGVGIGNFSEYRGEYVDGVALDAHNLPGEVLGELGVVGTLAFCLFFLAYAKNLHSLSKTSQKYESLTHNPRYRFLSICLTDAMLLLVMYGLTGHTLQAYHWYFYASFTVVALYYAKQELRAAQAQSATFDDAIQNPPFDAVGGVMR